MLSDLEKAKLLFEKGNFKAATKGALVLWRQEKTEELANFLGLLSDQQAMVEKKETERRKWRRESEWYHKTALKINPKSYEAYVGLGRLFMHRNKLTKAIYYYRKALYINPNFHHAQNGLGNVYQRINRPSLAMRWYKKALEKAPQRSIVMANISRLQARQGEKNSAKSSAARALILLKREKRERSWLTVDLESELKKIKKTGLVGF